MLAPRRRSTGQTTNRSRRSSTAAAVVATAASSFRSEGRATVTAAGGAGTGGAPDVTSMARVCPLSGREAAVHDQLGAGHERGLVAGQEERDVGDLARVGDPAERDPRLELLADRGREVRRLEGRVHDARVDHVAPD